MTLVRTGLRLGRRRAVVAIAVFAGILSGLGSCIMQELAQSQRANYEAQIAFARRASTACRATAGSAPRLRACRRERGVPEPAGVALYRDETEALGARARALQSIGGALSWTQGWLVTLLGIAALLVAVTVTTAGDLEARRLIAGWHPARASSRPLLVTAVSSLSAALIVTAGAAAGSLVAAAVGGRVWPLHAEPNQFAIPQLGPVALRHPSVTWMLPWASVVAAAIAVAWLVRRTLVAILVGGGAFALVALLSDALPAWFPWATLPATAGMWFHHRGEVVDVWKWPVTPLQDGTPSVDWTAIPTHDPRPAALAGAVIALLVVALATPWAARRSVD